MWAFLVIIDQGSKLQIFVDIFVSFFSCGGPWAGAYGAQWVNPALQGCWRRWSLKILYRNTYRRTIFLKLALILKNEIFNLKKKKELPRESFRTIIF